jgi:hypothetical protein
MRMPARMDTLPHTATHVEGGQIRTGASDETVALAVRRGDGQALAGCSSASTSSNSVHAQVGQVQLSNAPCLAASSADDQLDRLSTLPHFSHFLMSGMGLLPLRVQAPDGSDDMPAAALPTAAAM